MWVGCLVPVLLWGHPDVVGLSGYIVSKTAVTYTVDFSNAASEVEGLKGDYSKVVIDKTECSSAEDLK